MLDLIRKDLVIGAVFMPAVFVAIAFLSYIALWVMMDDFGGILLGFFTLLAIGLCTASSFLFIAIDHADKAELLYASLPIRKVAVVTARYVTSIMMLLLNFAIIKGVIHSAGYFSGGVDPDFALLGGWRWAVGIFCLMILILGYYLPFIFLFGAGRGARAALIVQVALLFAPPFFRFLLRLFEGVIVFDWGYFVELFRILMQWIAGLSKLEAILLLVLFMLGSMIISWALSVVFYKKLDL
ncbi:ABC-2 transporter permease [candidate division KSB1 bacterium]|nr:ABC-2 transporter permease [candidate division KSB1 bacterium]